MRPPLLESLTPFSRILFTVLLVISSFSLTFLAGLLLVNPLFGLSVQDVMHSLSDFNDPRTLRVLEFFQILQSIGLFIVPPVLAGYFFGRGPSSYLRFDRKSRLYIYILAFFLLSAALPFTNWMIALNEAIKFPEALKGIEAWMRETEDNAMRLTEAFMAMDSPADFAFNMVMIAIIPAIGEEMMFRGLLQRLFHEWTRNIHLSIFITAFLFSAMHFQFYGFIPRFALGLCFGYLFYWSGSLWVPIFAHFFNNGAAVVAAYLAGMGLIDGKWESFGETSSWWIIMLSTLTSAVLIYFIFRTSLSENSEEIQR